MSETLPPIQKRSSRGNSASALYRHANPLSASGPTPTSASRRRLLPRPTPTSQASQSSESAISHSSEDLVRLHALLTQTFTSDLTERHNHSLRKAISTRNAAGGFSTNDLPHLDLIVQNLLGRIDQQGANDIRHGESRERDHDTSDKTDAEAHAERHVSGSESGGKEEKKRTDAVPMYTSHLVALFQLLQEPIDCSPLRNQQSIPPVATSLASILTAAAKIVAHPTVCGATLLPALALLNSFVEGAIRHRANPPPRGGVARAWAEAQAVVVESDLSMLVNAVNACAQPLLAMGSRTPTDREEDAFIEKDSPVAPQGCNPPLNEAEQMAFLELVWRLSILPTQLDDMISKHTPKVLLLLLGSPAIEVTSREGLLIVESLWNCWEDADRESDIVAQIDTRECMHALGLALREAFQAKNSSTAAKKQSRNDIIALVALFSRQRDLTDSLVEGHVLEYCLRFACCGDVRTYHPDCRSTPLGTSPEDFEAMKLLLATVFPLLADHGSGAVVAASNLVALITVYIKSALSNDAGEKRLCRDWTQSQFDELLLLLLTLLPQVLAHVISQYHEHHLSTLLIELLIWAFEAEDNTAHNFVHTRTARIKGAANSFLATGDFCVEQLDHSAAEQVHNNGRRTFALLILQSVEKVLLLFHAQCAITISPDVREAKHPRQDDAEIDPVYASNPSEPSPSSLLRSLRQDFIEQQLLDLLKGYLSKHPGTTDSMGCKLASTTVSVMSLLCKDNERAQSQFASDGVDILLHYYDVDDDRLASDQAYQSLILAVLDATWDCVVSCTVTRDYFLQKEGIYQLLDLLQSCRDELQYMAFGVLTELCEYPAAVKHCLHWRNSGQVPYSIASLLVVLWAHQCELSGCDAIISGDNSDPFPLKAPAGSDIDTRGRIFMLAYLLGFSNLFDLASPEEKATLLFIEQYLNLKTGERWHDAKVSLKASGIVPTEDDDACLRVAEEANTRTIAGLLQRQAQALKIAEKMELSREEKSLSELRKSVRLADASAAEEQTYIGTTTTTMPTAS